MKAKQAECVDDTTLRKVSITTNSILFIDGETNEKVFELLSQMKHKYRMFLITQVSADGATDHLKAKAAI